MTETPEGPATHDLTTAAASDGSPEPAATPRQSLWHRLNRTNRIAALVLGAFAAVFAAALIFGAGMFVGAEYGDSEGHHDGSESSEHDGDDEQASGDRGSGSDGEADQDGTGGSEDGANRNGDGGFDVDGDQGQPNRQPQSEAPRSPTQAPGTP